MAGDAVDLPSHYCINCPAYNRKGMRVNQGCYWPRVKGHTVGKYRHWRVGMDCQPLDPVMLDAGILYGTASGLYGIGDQI